jgi:hypothetical protein
MAAGVLRSISPFVMLLLLLLLLLTDGLNGGKLFPCESTRLFRPVRDAFLVPHNVVKSTREPDSLASLPRRHFSLSI